MTDAQKTSIEEYRRDGYGYKKISQLTGLCECTVKTYCRRNGLTETAGGGEADGAAEAAEAAEAQAPAHGITDAAGATETHTHGITETHTHGITDPAGATEKPCLCCGKTIIQYPGRKEKKFCSDSCRNQWWNGHLNLVNRKAMYDFVCPACGKPFTAYGNRNRKYCSQECYFKDRFGGAACG